MNRRVLFAVQLLITVAFLAFIFARFDWAALRVVLGRITPTFYVASLAATVAGHLAYAYRWRVVLDGMAIPVGYAAVVVRYLIGLFFSNVLPTSVGGDAAKVYYLGRSTGFTDAGASVFVDRFLGLLWLSIVGAILVWRVASPGPLLATTRTLLTAIAIGMSALVVFAWMAPAAQAKASESRWRAVFDRLIDRVRAAASVPRTIVVAAIVVVLYQLLMTVVYIYYFALNGVVHPSVVAITSALFAMAVLVNVPLTVNGVGLREQLHVLLFSTMGLAREAAVSISLLMFSHFVLLSLAGGAAWLRLRPRTA